MSINLSAFDTIAACNKGNEIELIDPSTNSPSGMFITLIGSDSDEFREYTRTKTNQRLKRDAMAQKRGKETEIRTVESIESENIELLVLCTKGWRGIKDANDQEYPFTVQNAIALYKKYPKIYDQVNESVGNVELFLKN